MHKYMRAIGFSEYCDRKRWKEILSDVIINSEERAYTMSPDEVMLGEFSKNFAQDMGIAVCGEFDENEKFIYDYYYPYLKGSMVSSYEDITVERHAAKDSYAGVCDELRLGISLVFYLQNRIPYVKRQYNGSLPVKGTSLTLSGLSISGCVMLPVFKNEQQRQRSKRDSVNRSKLLTAARNGDEDAIETLTLEDMDMYNTIMRKVRKEDVFTLVDTYFMPYGVECDQYSVLGEIENIKMTTNQMTGEKIYILTICCNELTFDVSINIIDLMGEPQIGRRFKGVVWLQGFINFPEG